MSEHSSGHIPQTDLKAGYLAYRAEIDTAVQRVLDSGWYILGREVAAFEQAFAAYIGVDHAIGVGNGTDALELALRACDISSGDLVFTVAHTAVATVSAIELVGATPVFVDIDPVTYTMDPLSLEHALATAPPGRPKAVIPVHLYGHPADIPAILDIARRYELYVIEDCAQSHGATLAGRMTGAWGDLAAFSFYPTKNLGALGDGGMVVTSDSALAKRVRLLQQYGWQERYISDIPGGNSRLDELQAAILLVKLRHLDADNTNRQNLAHLYTRLLGATKLSLPEVRPGATHVFHQYVIRLADRTVLKEHLRQSNIGTLIHYPVPVHLQPAYRGRLNNSGLLPNTEHAAQEVLSLPIYPQMNEHQVHYVCEQIQRFLSNRGMGA